MGLKLSISRQSDHRASERGEAHFSAGSINRAKPIFAQPLRRTAPTPAPPSWVDRVPKLKGGDESLGRSGGRLEAIQALTKRRTPRSSDGSRRLARRLRASLPPRPAPASAQGGQWIRSVALVATRLPLRSWRRCRCTTCPAEGSMKILAFSRCAERATQGLIRRDAAADRELPVSGELERCACFMNEHVDVASARRRRIALILTRSPSG